MLSCRAVLLRLNASPSWRSWKAAVVASIAAIRERVVSAIVAENLCKRWTTGEGHVRAVDGVPFAFDEGTLIAFLLFQRQFVQSFTRAGIR